MALPGQQQIFPPTIQGVNVRSHQSEGEEWPDAGVALFFFLTAARERGQGQPLHFLTVRKERVIKRKKKKKKRTLRTEVARLLRKVEVTSCPVSQQCQVASESVCNVGQQTMLCCAPPHLRRVTSTTPLLHGPSPTPQKEKPRKKRKPVWQHGCSIIGARERSA